MAFQILPTATGPTRVTMTAIEASDPSGAEYYFENTAGGGSDSGWQSSRTYTDIGLQAGSYYAYRIRARDLAAAGNATAFSQPAAVTTPVESVLLATGFTGRTVSGKTASSNSWTTNGLQNPGGLTFAPGPGAPADTGLFDTPDAQHHFAPDINLGNEGPWSVSIPLVPERPAIALRRLTLDWQHFDNDGLFQISSRSAHWTATLSGSISGEISSVIANNVAGLSGKLTLEFPDSPVLTKLENYHLTLSVAGANTSGNNTSIKALSLIGSLLSVPPPLLAHYRFDEASAGTTPDAVGSAFATLGDRVAINTTPGLARVGSGVLELNGGDTTTDSPASGAVTSNSFDWTNSARTVTFWWRAKNPNVNTTQGTYLSSGSSAGAGTRFDIKEHSSSNSSLRVEIQSHFSNSNPANFDNGNWRFVAVVVPRNATLADVSWFIDGGTINFNTSTNLFPVITGTGPIVFGDSIVGSDHVPNGYLDDLQVYGDALDASQIAALYQNPGATLAPPEFTFADWTAAFGIAPGESGFLDDPDQDGVANGIDAWFGTHPGQPTTGLHSFTRSGLQFTFRHPHNPHPPSGLAASYQWSPDLTHWYNSGSGPDGGNIVIFTTADSGPDTLVTATAGNPDSTLFFRLRVTISEP